MELNKELRPLFHITGGVGWINDPNGLVYFNGKYHAFYQYYPYDTKWGPMHWGHVASTDLLHWERMPIALYPKTVSGEDGCFSGTAIEHDGVLYLVYTGFYENEGGDTVRQIQCLASSVDGVHFQKHGIIIGEDKLPNDYSICDFRDPKIWKEKDTFYMIVAAKKKNGRGHMLLFTSSDIYNWDFVGDILNEESLGTMIECPDYQCHLGLLIHSEQWQPREGSKHLNVHSNRYRVGSLDLNRGKFTETNSDIIDYGFDFYAPQTFSGADVMIGWMNMWDRNNPSQKYGFAGMLTIPRKIWISNGVLLQIPVWNYENQEVISIDGSTNFKFKYGAIKMKVFNLKSLEIKLRKKDNQYFNVVLGNKELIFDRSRSGEAIVGIEKDDDSINGIRRMPLVDLDNVEIEIIMDEFSIEFFVNGLAATFLVYPDIDADDVEINIDCGQCILSKSKF